MIGGKQYKKEKDVYKRQVLEDTLSKLAWKEKTSVIFEGSQGVLLDPALPVAVLFAPRAESIFKENCS